MDRVGAAIDEGMRPFGRVGAAMGKRVHPFCRVGANLGNGDRPRGGVRAEKCNWERPFGQTPPLRPGLRCVVSQTASQNPLPLAPAGNRGPPPAAPFLPNPNLHANTNLCPSRSGGLTPRMSPEEERDQGIGMRNKPERAPPHWLHTSVGLIEDPARWRCSTWPFVPM